MLIIYHLDQEKGYGGSVKIIMYGKHVYVSELTEKNVQNVINMQMKNLYQKLNVKKEPKKIVWHTNALIYFQSGIQLKMVI